MVLCFKRTVLLRAKNDNWAYKRLGNQEVEGVT
jgi:hypothetical protein